jgi:hypothetical protein
MTHEIKLKRWADCILETTVTVEADSREEAEHLARQMSETELDASAFTVASIDLTAFQGSSEVVDG